MKKMKLELKLERKRHKIKNDEKFKLYDS